MLVVENVVREGYIPKAVRSKNKLLTHCVPLDKKLVDWPKTKQNKKVAI